MSPTRVPYWLNHDDRNALAEAIASLLHGMDVHPTHRDLLDAVLTELGVVEARDAVWPVKAEIVRRASGYNRDVLPIRMSEDERGAVLTLPDLPTSVAQALTGGNEN